MTDAVTNTDLILLSEDFKKMMELPGAVFKDWEQMDLKEGLKLGIDYYLFAITQKQMLDNVFQFNAQIIFYKNDFNPFKLKVRMINEEKERKETVNTFMIGPEGNIITFLQQMAIEGFFAKYSLKTRAIYVART